MSPEEIQAIRERAEAATKGPWANYGDLTYEVYPVLTGDEEYEPENITHDVVRLADAVFIAHAREDVPALLAEVERLTGVVGEAHHFLSSGHGFGVTEGLVMLREILGGDAAIYQRTLAHADTLQASLDKVRALHRKDWWSATMTAYCTECNQSGRRALWPCATIQALDGSDQP